jgi:DNA-binding NtrC family response regulator
LTRLLREKNQALERAIAQRDAFGAERNHLANQLERISSDEATRWGIEGVIGQSPTLQDILKEIGLLQNAGMVRVLITGESGTGKELIARAIHYGSPRRRGPFVPVNCGAVPAELAESLFFGYTKGAFTGAEKDRPGYFELARGGTLFLDEVGDMPLEIQPTLLRVLEEEVVMPLGGTQERPLDVRVLASTNQDVSARLAAGTFRRDLYFRLAQCTVALPPLRERPEDIPILARHFLRIFAEEMARPVPRLTEAALGVLQAYSFPGNVRELKNIMERALLKSGGAEIGPEHLSLVAGGAAGGGRPESAMPAAEAPEPVDEIPLDLEQAEWLVIRRALAQTQGNVTEAAQVLRTSRSRIYRALERHHGKS